MSLKPQFAESAPNRTSFRVRYAETDQMGVVYHANYLVWMEIGRVELVRTFGLNYKELEQTEGLFLSVIEAHCRYVSPARYDQEIAVETQIRKSTARTLEFSYRICSGEGKQLLADGWTRHMWLNKELRPARLPSHYHAQLKTAESHDS